VISGPSWADLNEVFDWRQAPVVVVVVATSVALHPVAIEHVVLQDCVAEPDEVPQTTEQDEAVILLHSEDVEDGLLVVEGSRSVDSLVTVGSSGLASGAGVGTKFVPIVKEGKLVRPGNGAGVGGG
jgi:hypothetical protein